MKGTAIAFIAMLLAGCEILVPGEKSSGPDQCIRAELFMRCLEGLPSGPSTTKYNDWDEVVSACQSASYYQSLRTLEQIKPECRV